MRSLNLLPGRYYIDLNLHDPAFTSYDFIPSAAYIEIRKSDVLGSGIPLGQEHGLVYFNSDWELRTADAGDLCLSAGGKTICETIRS
jgi:hypothetical protein